MHVRQSRIDAENAVDSEGENALPGGHSSLESDRQAHRKEKRARTAASVASPRQQQASESKRRSPQPLTLSDGALDADEGAGECAQQ